MTSSAARTHILVFLVALHGGVAAAFAVPVSSSVQSCVISATRAAVENRNNQAGLNGLYTRYLGDPFARQAAKSGNWDKFSSKEKTLQRAWARKRTLAAVPRFLEYASADVAVQRQKGSKVYGRATLPKGGSTTLIWYLTPGGCSFYDLNAGGVSLSQLVGSYQKRRK